MLRSSPIVVAAVVFAVYAGWVAHANDHLHHPMTDFAFIGQEFVERSSTSTAIDADKRHIQSQSGFWLPTAVWMSAWWALLPLAFQSQF